MAWGVRTASFFSERDNQESWGTCFWWLELIDLSLLFKVTDALMTSWDAPSVLGVPRALHCRATTGAYLSEAEEGGTGTSGLRIIIIPDPGVCVCV
jgi:hypothetical protein